VCDATESGEKEALAYVLSMSFGGGLFTISLVALFWCISVVVDDD